MAYHREDARLLDYDETFQIFEELESNRLAQERSSSGFEDEKSSFDRERESLRRKIRSFINRERQETLAERLTSSRPRVIYTIIISTLIATICSTFFIVSFGLGSLMTNDPSPPENPRKGVVLASYLEQDVTWMSEMPDDWEIYRYVMDDPTAMYHPPVNAGREAMAYMTYIIDHYYDLPDYVVFIHGHERAWHQPEPIQWRLPTLNLEALEKDQYISLHCLSETSCNPAPRLDLRSDWDKLDKTGRLIPWFWRYAEISDTVPDTMSWPDGAQFAVTKKAIQRRSRDWWIHYRKPMLVDDERMNHFDNRGHYWGLLHERLWHVAMGMPPIYCPDQDYCTATQWSNGVLCDMYPALPIKQPWIKHKDVPDYVTCFKNDNGTEYWPMKRWSLCNETMYLLSSPSDCPFTGWPIP